MALTVKQMHVGIDLALQNLNSNLHGTFLPEEKDYFLNSVTREFLRLLLYREDPAPRGYLSLTDIKNYYSVLQHYIVNKKLELRKINDIFDVAMFPQLPVRTEVINTGLLYSGVKYRIITAGTGTELGTTASNTFGAANVPAGSIFTCVIPNVITTAGTFSLVVGNIYKIIKRGAVGIDFTTYGAADNNYGTVFTCTTAATAVVDTEISEVEVIAAAPIWNTATIKQVSTINYYYLISSNSLVSGGAPIMAGKLVQGVSYVVSTVGTTDFSSVGGYAVNRVGDVFKCTSGVLQSTKDKHLLSGGTGDITWAGGTVLYELKPSINRIAKPEDLKNLLTNAFGTTLNSPLSTMSDLNLNVYTNNNFVVYDVEAMYIKEPISIDFNNDVDSDLPSLVHELLVELTAKKIAGWTGGGEQPRQQQQQQQ